MAPASVHRVATKKKNPTAATTTVYDNRRTSTSFYRLSSESVRGGYRWGFFFFVDLIECSRVFHSLSPSRKRGLLGFTGLWMSRTGFDCIAHLFGSVSFVFFSMYRVLAFFKMSLTRCNQVSSSWAGFHWIALKIRIKISSTFFKEQSHKLLWILISAYPDAINDIPDTFFLSFSSMALTCWRVAGICAIFLFCCPQPNNTVTVLVLFFSFAAFPCKLRVSGKKKQNNEKENGKKKWAGVKTAEGPLIRNGGRWTVETP